jgi:ferredoxin-NADP reductase/uncharacterized protein YcbX
MNPVLSRIIRYPIKGLPGESLERTHLVPGHGIPHDRRFAIENGSRPALGHRKWADCKHFVRLTVNENLVRYAVRYDHQVRHLSITTPRSHTQGVFLDSEAQCAAFARFLTAEFASDHAGAVKLTEHERDLAYWDFDDAPLSIINLRSVEALSDLAQESLDPDRFRGNLMLEGLDPWEELGWVGRTIELDGLVLRITAPIERCVAINVDPVTARAGESVLHLLQQNFGHAYCGVYAQVISGGHLHTGARVMPPPASRKVSISRITPEGAGTVSLTLTDPAGDPLPTFVPGQHIAVASSDAEGTRHERMYSLSGPCTAPQAQYRISVKNAGGLSGRLHQLEVGASVEIGVPRGRFFCRPGSRKRVHVAAGIGITPMLAMLHHAADADRERPTWLFYGVRDASHFMFSQELRALSREMPKLRVHVFFSDTVPEAVDPSFGCHPGRLSTSALCGLLPFDAYDFYLCGPSGFVDGMSEGLSALEVAPQRIHTERFSLDEGAPDDPPRTSWQVRFQRSGVSAEWRNGTRSLLALAEQMNLTVRSDCRAGICGACRCSVRGRVQHSIEPSIALREDEALLCCARPLEDIEIAL